MNLTLGLTEAELAGETSQKDLQDKLAAILEKDSEWHQTTYLRVKYIQQDEKEPTTVALQLK